MTAISMAPPRFSGRLPETDCQTCLRVRHQLGRAFLAFESAASKALGFALGADITGRIPANVHVCEEMPVITGKDLVQMREQAYRLDQAAFAKKFGVPLARLQELEASEGDIGVAVNEFNPLDPNAKYRPGSDRVLAQSVPGKVVGVTSAPA
jgi:hypothetical protein